MKTIEATTKTEWQVSEWGEEQADHVSVRRPEGAWFDVNHESRIPTNWPDNVQSAVRAEILKHRPAWEDEWRQPDSNGCLYAFSVQDGTLLTMQLYPLITGWFNIGNFTDRLQAAARAWRDRQWQDVPGADGYALKRGDERHCWLRTPDKDECILAELVRSGASHLYQMPEPVISACCKLLGVERPEPELAPDQVRFDDGTVGRMRIDGKKLYISGRYGERHQVLPVDCASWNWGEITSESQRNRVREFARRNGPIESNQVRGPSGDIHTLRWHEGKAEQQYSLVYGDSWVKWLFSKDRSCDSEWERKADAWFRANCPADRFVTDEGEVLSLSFRDDEHAEARDANGKLYIDTKFPGMTGPLMDALYRFRDAERAKWLFKRRPDVVEVWHRDHGVGTFAECGPSPNLRRWPTWVRARAQAMWEGRQGRKVEFTASGLELRRNLGEPDTLHLINPQASNSELEKFHSWPRASLKVTIEPMGGE